MATHIIESIVDKVVNGVLKRYGVTSLNEAYDKYQDESKIQALLDEAEDAVATIVSRLGPAGLISVASETDFWDNISDLVVDATDVGITFEDMYRGFLTDYIIASLDYSHTDNTAPTQE